MSNAHETHTEPTYDPGRRRFLSATGAGTLAAGLTGGLNMDALAQNGPPTPTQQPPNLPPPVKFPPIADTNTEPDAGSPPNPFGPDKRLGYAIVGLGRLTLEQILPGFAQSKRCKPVALVSGDQNKARQVADQYGIKPQNLYTYENYDQIKNNPEIDIVYIVLPNSMHLEYTVRGAQAGKHILCEKPMATNVKDAQAMVDACKKANKKLMIAYRIQYEPHNRMAMEMLRNKELGTTKLITLHNGQNQGGDLEQWRLKKALAGGGSLPDVGIYCLNTARFLTGEEPLEVSADQYTTPGDPRFREVEETVNWTMRFPSGIQADCSTSYGWHEARWYRILGSDAHVTLGPAFSYENIRMMASHRSKTNPAVETAEERVIAPKQQFALEMDHMAECVVQDKTPFTPGEEGVQDHKIMAAIYESAHSNRPVKLPTITTLDTFRGSMPSKPS